MSGQAEPVGVSDAGAVNVLYGSANRLSASVTETTAGRHFELGIAETNLVGLLGELGATWSRYGQPLLPIGTIYDPFVGRALEPWSFGIYAGGQSILVGTPSGVTLGPEGGAHQSVITPSIGIEQPGCVAYEPAFGQDLEWTLLHALCYRDDRGRTLSHRQECAALLLAAGADAVGLTLRESHNQVRQWGLMDASPPPEPSLTVVPGPRLPDVSPGRP